MFECFVEIFRVFSERSEAEGQAWEQRRAEGPEFWPGCKALGYWDGKSEEKILRTTTTDGQKWHNLILGFPRMFPFFVFKILSDFFQQNVCPNFFQCFYIKIVRQFFANRFTLLKWSSNFFQYFYTKMVNQKKFSKRLH